MTDGSWDPPSVDGGEKPGAPGESTKWYSRKVGPMPVWAWLVGAFILVGAIGNLTEGEVDQPVAESESPPEVGRDEEATSGDASESTSGNESEEEPSTNDAEASDNGADEDTTGTVEVDADVTTSIATSTTEVVESEMDDEGDSEEDTTSTGDFDGPGIGDIITPQEYLSFLTVEDEVSRDGYDRDEWRHWHTKSWSGCTTREEVLVRTMVGEARSTSGDPCKATAAWWYSDYDGVWTSNSSDFDIDHIVALSEAHDSGAADWEADQKERFANDLTNLVAVSASSNRSKGDRDAAEWRPSRNYWCSFAYAVVEVKANWGLSVDPAEYDALEEMIDTCSPIMSESYNWWALGTTNNVEYTDRDLTPPTTTTVPATTTTAPAATTTAPATTVPATTAPPTTAPAPETTPAPSPPANPGDSKNCGDFSTYAEAKAWFDTYFPYYGDVARLDGDSDGEPCESLPGGPSA